MFYEFSKIFCHFEASNETFGISKIMWSCILMVQNLAKRLYIVQSLFLFFDVFDREWKSLFAFHGHVFKYI